MTADRDQAARSSLREPAFARLWGAGLSSEIGQWMLLLALPLYVLTMTGSALVTSTVAMLGLLPSLVCAPLAGMIADRWSRRWFLALVSLGQGAVLLPLLLVQGPGQLWIVYLVSAAQAGFGAMFEAAKVVTLPALVRHEQLVSANAMISLNATIGRLAGSPLGGVLLSQFGLRSVVFAGVGAFVVAAVLAATIPAGTESAGGEGVGFVSGLVAGAKSLWQVRTLRGPAICVALLSLAQGMFVVLFLLFVTELIGRGESEAGVLRGVQAIGGFAGAAVAGSLTRRLGAPRLLSWSPFAFGGVSALTWNFSLVQPGFWVYVCLFTVAGAPGVLAAAGCMSLLQQAAPPALRGQVLGSVLGLSDTLQALGMFVAGVLVGPVGTLFLLDAQASLFLVAGLLMWRMLAGPRVRRDRRHGSLWSGNRSRRERTA
ncbi:MFS transporter [Lentzea sp. NBC_00516]|uniref:MFS transporter n=1 Tax=Lentzea sp. NBC_00516 TaxID=2903582 RepID=UPI002E809EEA|nr:MFS transporter [Lentzea sp. NBC_00516]WUD27660.1 MFS transporter [Lentzea sp. NBC_00516]